MKRTIVFVLGLLAVGSTARADHIGLYLDATGESCVLPAGGYFTGTQAAVMQRYSAGTYGSRFAIQFPGGTQIFSFSTTFTPTGNITSDLTVGTGVCLDGDIVLGFLIGNLTTGLAQTGPALGFDHVLWLDCSFAELPGTGGLAYIGDGGQELCGDAFAVEQSSWGQVKSLYR